MLAEDTFAAIAALDESQRPMLTAGGFCGFDPYPLGEPSSPDLMKTIRNLPHVTMPGATYFVTFGVAKGRSLQAPDRDEVLQALLHWHGERWVVYAAVVLDDHVHIIARPCEGQALSDILRGVKRHTSLKINRRLRRVGPNWEDESFDHIIRDSRWLTRFIYYVCDNPVKRGLAQSIGEYPWLYVNGQEVATEDGRPMGHGLEMHRLKTCATQIEAHRLETCATQTEAHRLETCATQTETHRLETCATEARWFAERGESGFPGEEETDAIRVYTTRPDTLFGATYMVLAPEHPLVERITTQEHRDEVRRYVRQAASKSELERTAETKEKTGVFTGAYAINPVNRRKIPVWVADYVMMGYGTGAIMAVPAHDTRDLQFAEQFGLPVVQVVQPPEGADWRGYVDDGVAVNSGKYDGLPTAEFKERITRDLAEAGVARFMVNYKLRDWLFSRQRYWGEPFPIVHCDACGAVALPEDQLPLVLPEMEDFTPASSDDPNAPPEPPLARAAEWVRTTCPSCGAPAWRETNTMPQWAGSCWYYLRFLDPGNARTFCDPKVERYWMAPGPPGDASQSAIGNPQSAIPNQSSLGGVDLYVGGAEHAVLHLLYARFWHKVLYDLGHVSTPEPFGKLFNQGMIRSYAYRDRRGVYVPYEDVDLSGDRPRHRATGEELSESVEKMSKSLKNVVNPDDVIARYGADTFRLYEMFMGPLEASKPWNTRDVPGVHRFLHRVWRIWRMHPEGETVTMVYDPAHPPGDPSAPKGSLERETREMWERGQLPAGREQTERALHRLIRKVGEDVEAMKFNTAIAAMMEFVNIVYKNGGILKSQFERFVLVMSAFAPHLGEELWEHLGHDTSLAYEPWPEYDERMIVEETIELAVQVNGKVRARVTVPADADADQVVAAALAEPRVAAAIRGKEVLKRIVVPGRLVNIVVG